MLDNDSNEKNVYREKNSQGPNCFLKINQGMNATLKKGFLEIDNEKSSSKINHSSGFMKNAASKSIGQENIIA